MQYTPGSTSENWPRFGKFTEELRWPYEPVQQVHDGGKTRPINTFCCPAASHQLVHCVRTTLWHIPTTYLPSQIQWTNLQVLSKAFVDCRLQPDVQPTMGTCWSLSISTIRLELTQ